MNIGEKIRKTSRVNWTEELRDQITRMFADLPNAIPRPLLAERLDYSPRHLANKDSVGTGPPNPLRIGQRVFYEKNAVIEWMISRAAEHIKK